MEAGLQAELVGAFQPPGWDLGLVRTFRVLGCFFGVLAFECLVFLGA